MINHVTGKAALISPALKHSRREEIGWLMASPVVGPKDTLDADNIQWDIILCL